MLTNLASDARKCWPMHIAEGDSSLGARIGGLPPAGIVPESPNERTQYFGTFPISEGTTEEMSIFCAFDYLDHKNPCFFTRNIHKAIGAELVQCLFHPAAARAEDAPFRSELQAYRVTVGPETRDPEDPSTGVPHKIGGLPFLEYDHPSARGVSADLLADGYLHFLQWSTPGVGDCRVKGNWPFPNLSFHLYLKPTEGGLDHKVLLV